jgi:hypothetical protein
LAQGKLKCGAKACATRPLPAKNYKKPGLIDASASGVGGDFIMSDGSSKSL